MKPVLFLAFCGFLACASAYAFYEWFGMIRLGFAVVECAVGSCEAFRDGDYYTGVKEMVKAALDATILMGLAKKLDRADRAQDWAVGAPRPPRAYPYPPNLLSARSSVNRNYTMEELRIKQSNPMSIALYEAFTGNSGPHHRKRDTIEWPDVKYVQDDGHFEINLAVAPDGHELDKRQLEFAVYNRISMYVLEHAEGNWDIADDDYIDNLAGDAAGSISTSGGEAICGRAISEDGQGTAYMRMRMRHVSTSVEVLTLNYCDDNSRYEM